MTPEPQDLEQAKRAPESASESPVEVPLDNPPPEPPPSPVGLWGRIQRMRENFRQGREVLALRKKLSDSGQLDSLQRAVYWRNHRNQLIETGDMKSDWVMLPSWAVEHLPEIIHLLKKEPEKTWNRQQLDNILGLAGAVIPTIKNIFNIAVSVVPQTRNIAGVADQVVDHAENIDNLMSNPKVKAVIDALKMKAVNDYWKAHPGEYSDFGKNTPCEMVLVPRELKEKIYDFIDPIHVVVRHRRRQEQAKPSFWTRFISFFRPAPPYTKAFVALNKGLDALYKVKEPQIKQLQKDIESVQKKIKDLISSEDLNGMGANRDDLIDISYESLKADLTSREAELRRLYNNIDTNTQKADQILEKIEQFLKKSIQEREYVNSTEAFFDFLDINTETGEVLVNKQGLKELVSGAHEKYSITQQRYAQESIVLHDLLNAKKKLDGFRDQLIKSKDVYENLEEGSAEKSKIDKYISQFKAELKKAADAGHEMAKIDLATYALGEDPYNILTPFYYPPSLNEEALMSPSIAQESGQVLPAASAPGKPEIRLDRTQAELEQEVGVAEQEMLSKKAAYDKLVNPPSWISLWWGGGKPKATSEEIGQAKQLWQGASDRYNASVDAYNTFINPDYQPNQLTHRATLKQIAEDSTDLVCKERAQVALSIDSIKKGVHDSVVYGFPSPDMKSDLRKLARISRVGSDLATRLWAKNFCNSILTNDDFTHYKEDMQTCLAQENELAKMANDLKLKIHEEGARQIELRVRRQMKLKGIPSPDVYKRALDDFRGKLPNIGQDDLSTFKTELTNSARAGVELAEIDFAAYVLGQDAYNLNLSTPLFNKDELVNQDRELHKEILEQIIKESADPNCKERAQVILIIDRLKQEIQTAKLSVFSRAYWDVMIEQTKQDFGMISKGKRVMDDMLDLIKISREGQDESAKLLAEKFCQSMLSGPYGAEMRRYMQNMDRAPELAEQRKRKPGVPSGREELDFFKELRKIFDEGEHKASEAFEPIVEPYEEFKGPPVVIHEAPPPPILPPSIQLSLMSPSIAQESGQVLPVLLAAASAPGQPEIRLDRTQEELENELAVAEQEMSSKRAAYDGLVNPSWVSSWWRQKPAATVEEIEQAKQLWQEAERKFNVSVDAYNRFINPDYQPNQSNQPNQQTKQSM